MKKKVAVVLSIVMIVSVLAVCLSACNSNSDTGEKQKIDYVERFNSYMETNGGWIKQGYSWLKKTDRGIAISADDKGSYEENQKMLSSAVATAALFSSGANYIYYMMGDNYCIYTVDRLAVDYLYDFASRYSELSVKTESLAKYR